MEHIKVDVEKLKQQLLHLAGVDRPENYSEEDAGQTINEIVEQVGNLQSDRDQVVERYIRDFTSSSTTVVKDDVNEVEDEEKKSVEDFINID